MSTIRRVLAASVAVVATLTVASCDADQIGAAAVLGDDRIMVHDLQEQAEALTTLPGYEPGPDDPSAGQADLLSIHIRHGVLQRLAADNDIEVTEAEIDTEIEKSGAVPEGAPDVLAGVFRSNVYDNLVFQRIVEAGGGDQQSALDAFAATADELGLEVNPRYGTWDDQQLVVVAGSGSISEPVEPAPVLEAPAQ